MENKLSPVRSAAEPGGRLLEERGPRRKILDRGSSYPRIIFFNRVSRVSETQRVGHLLLRFVCQLPPPPPVKVPHEKLGLLCVKKQRGLSGIMAEFCHAHTQEAEAGGA